MVAFGCLASEQEYARPFCNKQVDDIYALTCMYDLFVSDTIGISVQALAAKICGMLTTCRRYFGTMREQLRRQDKSVKGI